MGGAPTVMRHGPGLRFPQTGAGRRGAADRYWSGEGECYSTGPRGLGDLVVRWPAIRFVALGGTGEPDHRPLVTISRPRSSGATGGRGRRLSPGACRNAAGGADRVACGGWLGRQPTGYQVFVCGSPYGAGRFLLAPASGADSAVVALVRLVRGEHGPPTLGQPGKFGACYGHQRRCVGMVGQLGEHVQPFPHRVAEYLPEYLVHRNVTVTFPPVRRLLAGRPAAGRVGRR